MQHYAHHVIAISTFTMSLLVPGGGYLSTAVANQHTEVSTPFMHARQIFFLYPQTPCIDPLKVINSVLFFLAFLFGRFVFQLRLAKDFFTWLATSEIAKVREVKIILFSFKLAMGVLNRRFSFIALSVKRQ